MRPTGTGTTVVIVSAASLAGGWWARYPELAMMGAVGLAAVATALTFALLMPSVPRIERNRPLGSVGGELEVLVLASGANRPARMRRWRVLDRVKTPAADAQEPLVILPPGALSYRFSAERRGHHVFGPPTAYWQDLLGLLRAEHTYGSDRATVSVWVRPRADESVKTATGRIRIEDEGPSAASAPVLGGTAFYGLRDYQPGDDVRLVDWRATARRGGQLIVRQYAVPNPIPAELGHVIVLDTCRRSYPGETTGDEAFENAVEIAASLCVAGARNGQATVLATTTAGPAAPRSVWQQGESTRDAMLDRLARVVLSPAGVSPWLWAVPQSGQEVGVLTVVTGTNGPDIPAALAADPRRVPVMTLVRTGEQTAATNIRESAGYAVTSISVGNSQQFAAAWNQVRPR